MEPISIRYRMTEPEFIAACNSHWTAHRQGKLSNVIAGALSLIIGLVLFFFFFWFAIFIVAGGATLLLITWLRSFMWRRAFREAKKYNDDISVIFSDNGLHIETAEGKSDLNWDFFTWYLDTPEYVLLYMTKRNFSVIPKKSFSDGKSINQFLDIVGARLKRNR